MNDEIDLVPYSLRRRQHHVEKKLPQNRSADEDINAVVDEAVRSDHRNQPVNLGFARMKGHRT